MDVSKMFRFVLVVVCWTLGVVVELTGSQSVPDPLFSRGCRAQRGQFPHETYCQQYYNCWDGRATIEECPGKLLFNPVISACDYPEAVNCLARLRNPEPSVTRDGRCLKQFGIFPDPLDCTAFYECSHGRAFRQVCPYYTAFDERYSVCVHSYSVECGGRGGIYGTLAPPLFNIPDGGIAGLSAQIGLPPLSGSGTSASGWDRRGLASSGHWSQSPPPIKGSSHGIGGVRRSGSSTGGSSAAAISIPDAETDKNNQGLSHGGSSSGTGLGDKSQGNLNRGENGSGHAGSGLGSSVHGGSGPGSSGHAGSGPGSLGHSGSSAGSSGHGVERGASDIGPVRNFPGSSGPGGARGDSGTGRIVSESGGVTRAPGIMNAGGSRGGGTGGRNAGGGTGGRNVGGRSGAGGSGIGGTGGGLSNSGRGSASRVGSAGTRGVSRGTQAGITGIVDKNISATGQERQYEKPISPETTFRCPQPRGLYPNAVDCSRFWLCREYKPSQLQCPTGQLFDLASLTCLHPEKAQCSSISPRT